MFVIKVLFLGPAKDLTGVESADVELDDGATVADAMRELSGRYPGLVEKLPSIRIAVNQTFAGADTPVHGGDELALIPPVSGGSKCEATLIDLIHGEIPVERVRDFVLGDAELGGIITFEGVTRQETHPEHGALLRLDYEAYQSMARSELSRLASEAKDRFSAGRVAIVHRLGPVTPGEVSVMIAVACAHRTQSFGACRWLIDMLKKDVPIWKKDVYENGHVAWVASVSAGH